jgi:hypothetical protein
MAGRSSAVNPVFVLFVAPHSRLFACIRGPFFVPFAPSRLLFIRSYFAAPEVTFPKLKLRSNFRTSASFP